MIKHDRLKILANDALDRLSDGTKVKAGMTVFKDVEIDLKPIIIKVKIVVLNALSSGLKGKRVTDSW